MLVGGLVALVAVAVAVVLVVLSPFGDDEELVAGAGSEGPTAGAPDAQDEQDTSAEAEPDPESAPPGPPLSQVDLDATEVRIDVGDGPVTIVLSDGQGELADGRQVRRVRDLTVRGDITGNGAEEVAVVLTVERGSGDAEVPALAVLTDDPDLGAAPLEPPLLAVPVRDGAWDAIEDGYIEAIGVREGGIEFALIAPPAGSASLVFTDQRADPLVDNRRVEARLTYSDGGWSAEADGPVTRAAADFTARAGVPAQELLCSGRSVLRGSNPTCVGTPMDGSGGDVEVSLLVVDDSGGFRGATGRPAPVSSAVEVRRIMGSGEHFCRDIADQAARDSLSWALPMAAVAYWFDDGRPERMDASQNGIPCQTVFDGVASFLNGADGVIAPYGAVLRP